MTADTWLGVDCFECGKTNPLFDTCRSLETGDVLTNADTQTIQHLAEEGVRCQVCEASLSASVIRRCGPPDDLDCRRD